MYTIRQKKELHEIIGKIRQADEIRNHFDLDGDKVTLCSSGEAAPLRDYGWGTIPHGPKREDKDSMLKSLKIMEAEVDKMASQTPDWTDDIQVIKDEPRPDAPARTTEILEDNDTPTDAPATPPAPTDSPRGMRTRSSTPDLHPFVENPDAHAKRMAASNSTNSEDNDPYETFTVKVLKNVPNFKFQCNRAFWGPVNMEIMTTQPDIAADRPRSNSRAFPTPALDHVTCDPVTPTEHHPLHVASSQKP
jgi:hypothetical protein